MLFHKTPKNFDTRKNYYKFTIIRKNIIFANIQIFDLCWIQCSRKIFAYIVMT